MSTAVVPKRRTNGAPAIVLWPLQLAVMVVFGLAGFHKLAGSEADVAIFTHLQLEPFGRVVIGLIEMGCAVVMMTKWASIGAFMGCGVMLGALLAHLTPKTGIGITMAAVEGGKYADGGMVFGIACVMFLVTGVLSYLRRKELPLFGGTL